jgi:homoserine O-succinyltransferase/O-acetyltransferase
MRALVPGRRDRASNNARGASVTIGLVNNMPDSALKTTERQFRELLTNAAGELTVTVRFFSLADLPRSAAGRLHVSKYYEAIDALWQSDLDGLIVTGAEPRALTLTDEPYWPTLAKLVDWAEDRTASTMWSCLAAHAAICHLDGIERRSLGRKLSGVFECSRLGKHRLLDACPRQWPVPHSRYNEIPEEMLISRGYRILTHADDAGADLFIKQGSSLHVFLQGHPEYGQESLSREYYRDVKRYLLGERDSYPDFPTGYFAEEVAAALLTFRAKALRTRNIALLSDFPASAMSHPAIPPWSDVAVRVYRNWLTYLAEGQATLLKSLSSCPAAPPLPERESVCCSQQATELDPENETGG